MNLSNWFKNKVDNSSNETFLFNKLTPNKNLDLDYENPSFKNALDFAIQDDELQNVAITGNYGSGKSSLLASYAERYSDKKFLRISLAEYQGYNLSDNGVSLSNEQLNVIEGKIINQLLHQIDPRSIKKSIFRTLTSNNGWRPFLLTAYLMILSINISYFSHQKFWKQLATDINQPKIISPEFRMVMLFLLLISVGFGLYCSFDYIMQNKAIKSLNIAGKNFSSDIEIFSDQSSGVSYFDKYLDDVLYLLEQSEADVIVFEDIDRFEDNSIFEKIKELNVLINNKRRSFKGQKASKLLFLYLVKDDMFLSKERTKFFDFIIPVLPVVTSSNSNDKLSRILETMKIKDGLSSDFLFKISLFIDDMRLLNNICNEYYAYKIELRREGNQEKSLDLDLEKIFATIVYKNIFPRDFSLLQLNQGFLYHLFENKDSQKRQLMLEIDKEIENLENELKEIRAEHLSDEVELYGTIFKIPAGREVISVNGKFQASFNSYHDFIEELLGDDSEIISYADYYDARQKQNKKIEKLEDIFPERDNPDFKKRLFNVRSKVQVQKMEQELEKLSAQRKSIGNKLIKDVYTNQDIHSLLSENNDNQTNEHFKMLVKNPQFDLIYFLVKNAYIDETYSDYLTYFYGHNLTKNDREFLRNIASGKATEHHFKLNKIGEVYQRLSKAEFHKEEVCNYDLVDYILATPQLKDREENLKAIFKQNTSLNFFVRLAEELFKEDSSRYNTRLFITFMEVWLKENPELFVSYMQSLNCQPFVNDFIYSILNFVPLSDSDISVKEVIRDYLDANCDLITPNKEFTSLFSGNLSAIAIQFDKFSAPGEREDWIDRKNSFLDIVTFIYENNLYRINEHNLNFFMWWFKGEQFWSEDDFTHKNFELLNTNEQYKPLLNYIEDSLSDYMTVYLKVCGGTISDNPVFLSKLLKCETIYESLADYKEDEEETQVERLIQYIPNNSIVFVYEDYEELSEDNIDILVRELVHYHKAVVNTDIILTYFAATNNYDNNLMNFINNGDEFTFDNKSFGEFIEEVRVDFIDKTVECVSLDDKHYREIVSKMNWYDPAFSKVGLDSSKITILVDYEVIKFNEETLNFLRENYEAEVIYFIKKHLEEYLELEAELRHEDELLALLDDSELTDDDKILIADCLSSISIKDKNYPNNLMIHILENQFDEKDIAYIITSQFYDSVEKTIKSIVKSIVIANLEVVADKYYESISDQLVELLIKEYEADLISIKKLLYNYFIYTPNLTMKKESQDAYARFVNLFTVSENIEALKELDAFGEWEKVIKEFNKAGNRWKLINDTKLNRAMATFLRDKYQVSSISDQGNKIRINSFKNNNPLEKFIK